MDRALTGGVSAGTSLALGLQLLKNLEHHYESSRFQNPSLLEICPAAPRWFELHLVSLLIGLFAGLFLGPLLEGVITARVLIYQSVVRRTAQSFGSGGFPGRPLFRIH